MTKRMEQTQNAKMVQLALFREYGFQPCLKDIKILNTRDFDEFPGHVEAYRKQPAMHEAEHDITCRIIAAMVAEAGGFKSRNEWTAEIKEALK